MTRRFRSRLAVVIALFAPAVAVAQTGAIAGRVTDSTKSQPLSGAQIQVRDPAGRNLGSAVSGAGGAYRVENLPAGTYSVLVTLIPYSPKRFDGVAVSAGGTATVDAVLVGQVYQLSDVQVTSVSRVPEKLTDAPASISVVPAVQIQERASLSILDHLKTAPGIAYSEGGLVQSNIVSRGFNNIFGGSLLILVDNRYASVPSLRVNVPTFIPTTSDDIEQMEFVLGPGAALYGPNVTSGVLHIITKSPLTSPGTTMSVEGGFRSSSPSVETTNASDNGGGVFKIGFRHATRISPKVGFKVSGEYLTGKDWRYADPGDTLSPGSTATTRTKCTTSYTGCRDFDLKRWGGEARLDVKPNDNTEWITSYGRTQAANMIELTGIGAGQARDWRYQHIQTRFRHKDLFVQFFSNFSNAGETFLLRDGNQLIDKSRVYVGQIQHGFALGSKQTFIYGADYVHTDARTEGTINGANEDIDTIKEFGAYLHSVSRLSPKLDLVTALRVDKHNALESAVFSPRVALVIKPNEFNNLRLTYNRAFSTPTNNGLFLDISAGRLGPLPYTIRALGVPKSGFHFRAGGGCTGGVGNLCSRSPFRPQDGQFAAATPELWKAAVNFFLANPQVPASLKQLLQGTPAPSGTQVATKLRTLNATTGSFIDIQPEQVRDIEALKPSITNTLEAGYKGKLGGKARLAIDAYYERRENFVGPLIVESPSAFLDGAQLVAYLTAVWTAGQIPGAAQTAQQLGAQIAQLPLATIVPNDNNPLTSRPDVFLTYRNFGSVDLFGADVAFDYVVNDRWSFAATWSFVNKDLFTAAEINGPTDLALNASKNRGSATVRLRDDSKGWATELRFRAVKGFPVSSGVYVSPQRSDGTFVPTGSYGIVDLQGSIRPRFGARNMIITASINNVLGHSYATFVGVPKLGRTVLTKISYTF